VDARMRRVKKKKSEMGIPINSILTISPMEKEKASKMTSSQKFQRKCECMPKKA